MKAMTPEDWAAEEAAIGLAEFERDLRRWSPKSIDPLEWAVYNNWVSEQRTAFANESVSKRP